MISKKGIISLAVTAFVLLCTFVALNFLSPAEDDVNISDDSSISIFSVPRDDVVRMDMSVDGENFALVRSEEGWLLEGKEDVKIKTILADYLCGELAGVNASRKLAEKSDDLSVYGLNPAMGTYKITLNDGTEKTFLLGKKDPISGHYFFKTADDDTVYTIFSTNGDAIFNKSDYYKTSDIVKVDTENLSRIRMNTPKISLELETVLLADGTKTWNMIKPMKRGTDVGQVYNIILSKLSYIEVSEFVDEKSERYALSGVNNPEAVIELADAYGISQTFYLGKSEDSMRYIKTNGRVYLVNDNWTDFVDIDPFLYVDKFIHLNNIDNVDKIEVTKGDITYEATVSGEGEAAVYKLNGTEVMDTKFRREVYQKIIGLLADDFAKKPVYSSPEYTVKFYMKDGTVKKTEYCVYDDRSYAAYNDNGTCEFIIRKKKLSEMFASLENVLVNR